MDVPALSVFRQVMVWLWKRHREWQERSIANAIPIYDEIPPPFSCVSSKEELEDLLPKEGRPSANLIKRDKFLYLDPVTKGGLLLPIMTLSCNFQLSIPDIDVRCFFFYTDKDSERVKTIGYRFEAPHGLGMHFYYHAQLINSALGTPGESAHRVPETQPAFALDACCPVSMLIAVLLSIYGGKGIDGLAIDHWGGVLKSALQRTHFRQLEERKRYYWRVGTGESARYYVTWYKATQFRDVIMARSPKSRRGQQMEPVSHKEFSEAAEDLRGIC